MNKIAMEKAISELGEAEVIADLAEAIIRIADVAELLQSRLTMRALKILIKDLCPSNVSLYDIESVLHAIPQLKNYVKQS